MAGGRLTLAELGEDRFVADLTRLIPDSSRVLVGPGDDCAVVREPDGSLLLLKTDCVVEGVHYLPAEKPQRVGRKALCRALSDIAAMGGKPADALLTVFSPPETPAGYWKSVYRGALEAASKYGVDIVGGETSSAPFRAINVALTGRLSDSRFVTRSGGAPGDVLFVTGLLGGSLKRKHWAFEPRIAEGNWLAAPGRANAMMDLSDGLAADLPRLAAASGCAFRVESIPRASGISLRAALHDGEDYELLFAVAAKNARRLDAGFRKKFPHLPLTRIGSLESGTPGSGNLDSGGFHHFSVASERRT